MSKENRSYHAGVRMTDKLWAKVVTYSTLQKIPAAEYCRRAIEKQIEHDETGDITEKEELKQEIIAILEELGVSFTKPKN